MLEFNGKSDRVHLIIDYKPDILLSTLMGNLKTVISRLIRKEYPWLAQKYFYNKPYFWTGSYFVVSCGGATYDRIKSNGNDRFFNDEAKKTRPCGHLCPRYSEVC
ncbi:IS200/IS605 family transposase [Argonema galeatum]|uniref:IS200/IS605 family transposase n=1 Tax=Argonema galeatum TaxID=2942762 RepID=UPI003B849119|nr:transposase [Argonema galeatum A003/A1]